jgi:CO dehydrogenase/acetyl-CoA synthase epsilon subunit
LDGAKFTGIDALGAGDEVIVFGKLYKYVKDSKVTPEIAKGNYLVSLVKAGSGGSDAAKGTKENPYNVAEALAAINALADNGYSDAEVYVKGTVVKVTTTQANFEKYGNLNYLISADGTESNTITVYSGDALNGAKFTGIDALGAGDVVIVYGKLQKYVKNDNVTPEIAKGNYLVSLVKAGSGGSDAAKGTKDNPYNIAEALAAINALADNGYSDAEVYVKGKVVKVTTTQANFEKYGNLNYLISEDGTETNTITVYSGDALNGAKFTGIDALKQNDEVIVYGKLQKYVKNSNVTPEIAKGNYLVSLNGKTE